jgi:hypothetical protein
MSRFLAFHKATEYSSGLIDLTNNGVSQGGRTEPKTSAFVRATAILFI